MSSLYWTAFSQLVIATVHGLLGAWLAVRMVFRPLNPVYIFGFRVPFTPGMIPAERQRFIETLARVFADRVLTVETMTDEILSLGIHSQIDSVSADQYTQHTTSEGFIRTVSEKLVLTLENIQQTAQLADRLDTVLAGIVVAETATKYGALGKTVASAIVDAGLIRKILSASLQDIAEQISRNPLSRTALLEALETAGQQIFPDESADALGSVASPYPSDFSATDDFILSLGQRIDIERILRAQLARLTDEMIEEMVYKAVGRELTMIIRFGGIVGFGVGIFQGLLVLLSRW